MEVKISSENFKSLKDGDKPLVVDFWATWCGPCRMVAPIISKMAEKYDAGIFSMQKYNLHENKLYYVLENGETGDVDIWD